MSVEAGQKKRKPAFQRRLIALKHVQQLEDDGFTPLAVIIKVMRKGLPESGLRQDQYDAAIQAAPYVHPKLAAIAYQPVEDPARAARRSLLAQLTLEERQKIAAILQGAKLALGSEDGAVVDGEARDIEESGE